MQRVIIRNVTKILILLLCMQLSHCAPNKNQTEKTSSDTALVDDIKWFFRGIGNFAATVERMLPNIKTNNKNKTFSENTRLTLLIGLRHVLVGMREITTTFEQSFKTDHIKQLQQFKNATNYVNDIINSLKMWFRQIRALAVHLYSLYNRYIPEVLFGKCLGNYLMVAYPDRFFYEYPFLLFWEIYGSVMPVNDEPPASDQHADSSTNVNDDLNMAQNEILHTDADQVDEITYVSSKYPRHAVAETVADDTTSEESIFNLSTVVTEDKDTIIDYAIQQKSWRICLKLYTAESISRSLRSYFLNL